MISAGGKSANFSRTRLLRNHLIMVILTLLETNTAGNACTLNVAKMAFNDGCFASILIFVH